MKYFSVSFRISFAQRLRNVKSWLLLLLLPLLLIGVRVLLPQEQITAPVLVGVVLPDDGAETFWELLEQRSGTVLTFVQTDELTVDRNIATGKWDCGLILQEGFEEKLRNADTDQLFVLRIAEGSSVYPLVQETVSACVASLIRLPIAEEYLFSSGIADCTSNLGYIHDQLDSMLAPSDRVNISISTPTGEPLQSIHLTDRGIQEFLRWVIYVGITVWLLLCVYDLGRWNSTNATKRITPMQSVPASMLSKLGADSVMAILSGLLCILVIGDGIYGCVAVITYVLFLSGIGIVAARFPAIWQSIPVIPAFIVVASLIFSGVLMDISEFLPEISGILKWLPSRQFLLLCEGSIPSVFLFLGIFTICLLPSFIIDHIKKRCA